MLCLTGTAHAVFVPVNEELAPEQLPLGGGLVGGLLVSMLHGLLGELATYAVSRYDSTLAANCSRPLSLSRKKAAAKSSPITRQPKPTRR